MAVNQTEVNRLEGSYAWQMYSSLCIGTASSSFLNKCYPPVELCCSTFDLEQKLSVSHGNMASTS